MHRRALLAPTRSSEPSQQRPRRRPRRPARLHRFLCNPTWRIRQSTMTRAWHYSMPRARNLDHPTSVMRVPPARYVQAFEPAWPRARSACGPLRLDRARSASACESIRAPCSSSPRLECVTAACKVGASEMAFVWPVPLRACAWPRAWSAYLVITYRLSSRCACTAEHSRLQPAPPSRRSKDRGAAQGGQLDCIASCATQPGVFANQQ